MSAEIGPEAGPMGHDLSGSEKLSIRTQTLKRVTLFGELHGNPAALEALAEIMEDRHYEPGATIIEERAVGSDLYILISGEVAVYKSTPEGDSFKVAVLNGESCPVFGESGLIESEPRSATIRAATPAHCLLLDRAGFDRFSALHPQWALPVYRRIAQAVLGRFKKANDDLMLLYKALMAEIRGS
jgi:CRP/FNR family cyclic AMP-dependent transcriptional regulator